MIKNKFIPYRNNLNLNPYSDIYFVGLSHKLGKDGYVLDAFSDCTNSGKIISKITNLYTKNKNIYKTNLVNGVPLIENKIRYPNEYEKKIGLNRLKREIHIFKPKIIYLFGKQVSDFVIKNLELEKINDNKYIKEESIFILTEHPSYIAVYKRKNIDEYIIGIINTINDNF